MAQLFLWPLKSVLFLLLTHIQRSFSRDKATRDYKQVQSFFFFCNPSSFIHLCASLYEHSLHFKNCSFSIIQRVVTQLNPFSKHLLGITTTLKKSAIITSLVRHGCLEMTSFICYGCPNERFMNIVSSLI